MQIQLGEEIHVTYPYPSHQKIDKPITLSVKVRVGLDAEAARRLVNIQLMLKFGQLVVTGEPELYIDRDNIHWKVPLRIVSPDGDNKIYFLNKYVLVDAVAGNYDMDEQFVKELKEEVRPILRQLYPEPQKYDDKIVYVNDPKFSDAPKEVTWKDFSAAWEAVGHFGAILNKKEE